jgi:ferritin-like metal-binding protein YciE
VIRASARKEIEAMNTMPDKAREVYIAGLRNQHAVENQAIELLERQVGRLENYPEMRDRMQRHIQESHEQAKRLEDLLSALGTSHSSTKDMAMSVVGNLMAVGHSVTPDEVIKNTFANFAFEHYEIASYKALLVLAETVGHAPGQSMLETSLKEEQAMADWIDQHIRPTTLRYLERSAAGQKAGV